MSEPDATQWKREAAAVFEADTVHYADGRENAPWYRTQLAFVMQALAGQSGRVLDLGCAAGVEITALRSAGFTVVGADYVHLMLRESQRRTAAIPTLRWRAPDSSVPPLRRFDLRPCCVPGRLRVFAILRSIDRELYRVLRPGGTVVIALPSRLSLYALSYAAEQATLAPIWRTAKRALGKTTNGTVPQHHRNPCVPGRFLAQLEHAGLRPFDHANTAFLLSPLDRFWPSGQDRLAGALERFGRTPGLGWMGSQFMVAARKR